MPLWKIGRAHLSPSFLTLFAFQRFPEVAFHPCKKSTTAFHFFSPREFIAWLGKIQILTPFFPFLLCCFLLSFFLIVAIAF